MNAAAVQRDPSVSAAAIRHHYDLSGEFYRLWLDPTMTYSAALWEDDHGAGIDDLEAAQCAKVDWHLRQAALRPGDRLLDIGAGWGALAARAVGGFGARAVTGLTLSPVQAAWIRAHRPRNVDVKVESWFDHRPERPYDAIVSVEAFEAFARIGQTLEEKRAGYRRFFHACREWLRPGGRMSLQTITHERPGRAANDFFSTQVFPEAELPHLEDVVIACRGLFEIALLRNDRLHYARTLSRWLQALRAGRAQAAGEVGDATVRRYERYLGLSQVAFHTGAMGLARIALQRID